MTPRLPAGSRSFRDTRPRAAVNPKTERPESFPADRPIDHHVAGHAAEHPDKPGRPRSDRTDGSLVAPQPRAPGLDVQIRGSRSVWPARRWRHAPRPRATPTFPRGSGKEVVAEPSTRRGILARALNAPETSLWLVALGAIASAISFLMRPPKGGGVRYWNPLDARQRLTFAIGSASVVLLALGAVLALVPRSSGFHIDRWVVLLGSAVLLSVLLYGVDVAQLYRDRRTVLKHYVGNSWQREVAVRTARVAWCARHPLLGSEWWPDVSTAESPQSDASSARR